jgi:hypothetical protein
VEPQLAVLAVQLPAVRLAQQQALLGEQVDVERRRGELRRGQSFESVPDLRFHSTLTQPIPWML